MDMDYRYFIYLCENTVKHNSPNSCINISPVVIVLLTEVKHSIAEHRNY